jgi:transcriptional regulator with XRE-family HTH domain
MTIGSEYVLAKRHRINTIGETLRNAREFNELSQTQLAKKARIPQSAISAIESDKMELGVERAKRFARALNVHPAVLLFPDWEEPKRPKRVAAKRAA